MRFGHVGVYPRPLSRILPRSLAGNAKVRAVALSIAMAPNEIIGWVAGLVFGFTLTAGGIVALIENTVLAPPLRAARPSPSAQGPITYFLAAALPSKPVRTTGPCRSRATPRSCQVEHHDLMFGIATHVLLQVS